MDTVSFLKMKFFEDYYEMLTSFVFIFFFFIAAEIWKLASTSAMFMSCSEIWENKKGESDIFHLD